MSFLVTGCGHSGTKFLAEQLNKAKGWTVEHEPTTAMSPKLVNPRFEGKDKYGEVNSYLLASVRQIKADKKAMILRNPYDVCRSIARTGRGQLAVDYTRECVAYIENLILHAKLPTILFRKMTTDVDYLVACAKMLGVMNLSPESVDLREKINSHRETPVPLHFDTITQIEFDNFIEAYNL